MNETDAGIEQVISELAEGIIDCIDRGVTATLPNGRTVTATLHYDDSASLFDDDCYGTIEPVGTDRYTGEPKPRPDGYDGRARKVHTRDETFWWQPDENIPDEGLTSAYNVVRGWLNDEWQYVGVTVEIGDAHAGLWAIDMSGSYSENLAVLADVLGDLVAEALADPTANQCPCCKRDYE